MNTIIKKEKIKYILIVLNSSQPIVEKYTIGNLELTKQVKDLEKKGLIKFDSFRSKWI